MGKCNLPCGRCRIGTYSVVPVINGLLELSNCKSKSEAIKMSPRCKSYPRLVCDGARGFVESESFPIKKSRILYLLKMMFTTPANTKRDGNG